MERGRPIRRIHLLGGLTAFDNGSQSVYIGIGIERPLIQFPRPPYAEIYGHLIKINLPVVGAEFLDEQSIKRLRSPDWWCASPRAGFRQKDEFRAWSAIRHAAQRDGRSDVADAAARCSTYLDLLGIRLLELSTAYNDMLREWHAGRNEIDENLLHSSTFMRHIDAAIHAFLADAASLRDLTAAIVWRFILGEQEQVTTLGTFLKKAKAHGEPLAIEICAAGQDGGWFKILSGLRDQIVHVAPMGSQQSDHSCRIKAVRCNEGVVVPALHYAISSPEGSVPPPELEIAETNEQALAALRRYAAFHKASIDGLDYCWRTVDRFVDVLSRVRATAGFRQEVLGSGPIDLRGAI